MASATAATTLVPMRRHQNPNLRHREGCAAMIDLAKGLFDWIDATLTELGAAFCDAHHRVAAKSET
jgi:hypothetical protein